MSDFPSIRLFLIRHAQARNAAGSSYDDASLSAVGRTQGDAVAGAIAARQPDAIFASPAARARQTADLIARAACLPVAVDERLREFVFGSISDPGLTLEQLRERRDDLLAWRPDRRLAADSDTPREFAVRVKAALDQIVTRHVAERVVVVAHAGTIDIAMNWAMGVDPGTPVMHDFPIANASITELIHWPARPHRRRLPALYRIRERRIAGARAARGSQRQLSRMRFPAIRRQRRSVRPPVTPR